MRVVIRNILLVILSTSCSAYNYEDEFSEELIIKPLSSGQIYTQFKFVVEKSSDPTDQSSFKHFRLFPRSLGEIIAENTVQELHFSLTQGLWRYEKWGYPYRDAPPGVEVWAWFQENTENVDGNWKNLVNTLSGQFCASLNFIDKTNTVEPRFSYRPQGAVPSGKSYNSSFARYATLPSEIVCTENLTPFKKLLPCDTKVGLSTLLNAIKLFNANFISLSLDYQAVCKDTNCMKKAIQLVQSISVVFDPPIHHFGQQDWSFVKLFGTALVSPCPVATKSVLYVDISTNKTGIPFDLQPQTEVILSKGDATFAVYNLHEFCNANKLLNVHAHYAQKHIYWNIPPPVVFANRRLTGYGQERGGIQCIFHNNHRTKSLQVLYMDVIPWFLRVYLHTLTIKANGKLIKPGYMHYVPGKDRDRPHHIEVLFTAPPRSQTTIHFQFEYVFLMWTEYPPDANHGFSVGPATISTMVPNANNFTRFPSSTSSEREDGFSFLRIRTQILLVCLPTPDFSMPYNVICLSCTVVALAFGPIHNITTKRLLPYNEEEDSIVKKLKKQYEKCRDRLIKWMKRNDDEPSEMFESKKDL